VFKALKQYGNLSESVVRQITEALDRGDLQPGEKLPTERDMCAQFAVSRTVIRDAMKTLTGLGIVTVKHGTGAYINAHPNNVRNITAFLDIMPGSMEELFQVREVLESKAVFWCAQNASPEDLKQLESIIDNANNLDDESQLPLFDAEFHLKICEAAGNRVLTRLMLSLLDLLGDVREKTFQIPGRQRLSVREHEAILNAIKSRDPDAASAAMLKHLANVKSAVS
jgi:GntR family transcriptional repressor for pyruvate dehydrogenase complex